jgi:hypothetical protein
MTMSDLCIQSIQIHNCAITMIEWFKYFLCDTMIEENSKVQRIHTIILDVRLNICNTPTITFELDYF